MRKDAERRQSCDWRDVSVSQGLLAHARNWKRQEKFSRVIGESMALLSL
jgi:hypothetical protein